MVDGIKNSLKFVMEIRPLDLLYMPGQTQPGTQEPSRDRFHRI